MALFVVDRNLQPLRKLGREEFEQAANFYAGAVVSAPQIIRDVRRDRYWLQCDCREPRPVMNVALRDEGRYVLRNNPDAAEHAPDCCFERQKSGNGNRSNDHGHSLNMIDSSGRIALHSEFSGVSRGIPPQISRSAPESGSKKTLLMLLMTLIEQAQLGVVTPGAVKTITEQYAAIRSVIRMFVLSNGVPLEAVTETRINKRSLVSVANALRESDGERRQYGLLLDCVEQVVSRTIHLYGGDSVDFFGRTEYIAGKPDCPALALVTVASKTADSNFYELAKVALVGVLSRNHLFPVHSELDRQHVGDLINLLDWLNDKGVLVTARRRMFQAGTGYEIELYSGPKLITVDLDPHGIAGDAPSHSNYLALCDYESFDALKKVIIRCFLGLKR